MAYIRTSIVRAPRAPLWFDVPDRKQVFYVYRTAFLLSVLFVAQTSLAEVPTSTSIVPPAYPLVACDPYFSIWQQGETLTDAGTTHWTGKSQRLASYAKVDGKVYRLLGAEPKGTPAFEQKSHLITPTRSVFELEGAGVGIELTFMTPAIPYDIDLLSRPVTYVSYTMKSTDGKEHDVQLMFAASGEVAVNEPDQPVEAITKDLEGAEVARIGSVDQRILWRSGDDLRIDWGYFYLAADGDQAQGTSLRSEADVLEGFDPTKDAKKELTGEAGNVVATLALKPVKVGNEAAKQWLVLAYDDIYSIEFMRNPLRPYWRRNGLDGEGLVKETLRDYSKNLEACKKFDDELMTDLIAVGGSEYMEIACLAYRQCFAAGKFVADANGQPLQFSKENHSNGCIATSDVFYPMSPQFLLFGLSLAKSFVAPFMEYAESERWRFPFAPHDLGTYPKANGQVYGGGERSEENQMPVEESGNMLILMAAIAKLEGNANFAEQYWPRLTQWAEYLRQQGFDPESQLCTDDFAGHMAHNVNLSAKAIVALGAFAQLCELRGDQVMADEYRATAEKFAKRWMEEADDGDHYRLAFDRGGTWSQKYNLVWDRVLGLNLFPEAVLEKEMAYYRRVQNRYGLPLDNRREYTKLDWIVWTATLTQNDDDFVALIRPVHRFLKETPDRSPMTDWYETKTGRKVGFTARPVVGGVYMPLLHKDNIWTKWSARDTTAATGYADLPKPPVIEPVVPAADTQVATWRYTTTKPEGDWMDASFDDAKWRSGRSGFGSEGTPSARIGTEWTTPNIWLRRTFDVDPELADELKLHVHFDEATEIYINGVLAAKTTGYVTDYQQIPISDEALKTLKPTGNVLAVHCNQKTGGQYIDVGLVTIKPAE